MKEGRRPRIKKTLEQQVASAQNKLNRLKYKEKQEGKKVDTRRKIILGAEVAKALGCNIEKVDKELVLGMLLEIPSLHENDVNQYKIKGRIFLANMIGRQI